MSNQEQCLYCQRDSHEVPLITIRHRDEYYWICPQHLPILIHKPEKLADKLPGAANLGDAEEHHH